MFSTIRWFDPSPQAPPAYGERPVVIPGRSCHRSLLQGLHSLNPLETSGIFSRSVPSGLPMAETGSPPTHVHDRPPHTPHPQDRIPPQDSQNRAEFHELSDRKRVAPPSRDQRGYPPLKKMSGPSDPPQGVLRTETGPPPLQARGVVTHFYPSVASGRSPAGKGSFPLEKGGVRDREGESRAPLSQIGQPPTTPLRG